MKYILFCTNSYSFAILSPFVEIFKQNKYEWVWFVDKKILNTFPFINQKFTSKISELKLFRSDVILVPGNEVPHYLRGVKAQVFHGFAGEKKGHFRIREYFDIYLTQGPYFTKEFKKLKNIHKNFEVKETGWPKLDYLFDKKFLLEKSKLIKEHQVKKIILYAPTFSPKLTSADYVLPEIDKISQENSDLLFLVKFHPLMDKKFIRICEEIDSVNKNVILVKDQNILKSLCISDLLISDTSSSIYEFLLLDKPVISFKNISKNILWQNFSKISELKSLINNNLSLDPFKNNRKIIFDNYHPYKDGRSTIRVINSLDDYIKRHGVPNNRKLSLYRKIKIFLKFGFNN
tara:strand:+ start:2151 stop:3188 length:1038 start_codon:yes stop_codon:yes gene_type:complete